MENGPEELGPKAVPKVSHGMGGTGGLSIATCHFGTIDIKITYFVF